MKRLLALALGLWLGGTVAAQMGGPAEELKRYEPMLGNWEGSGGGNSAPGVPMKWTSKSTMKKILGGHFIQDDTQIEVEGFGTLVMRTVYGWDAARKRHFALNVSNLGSPSEGTIFWAGDKRIVQSHTTKGYEGVVSERWITDIEADKIRFVGTKSVDGGKPFIHVEGSITRGGEGFDADKAKAEAAMPATPHMKRMKVFAGMWKSTGHWNDPESGAATEMTGESTMQPAFGGHVLYGHGTMEMNMGEAPMTVASRSYGYWSDKHQAYRWVGMNSMGMYHGSSGYEAGAHRTVWMSSGIFMGKPMVGRLVIEEDGDSLHMIEHGIGPKGEPQVSWKGKMTRVKG